jgi:hypothetical protein
LLWPMHQLQCLAGYQTDPSYGTVVYFALEALSGIARDIRGPRERRQLRSRRTGYELDSFPHHEFT